MASKHVTGSWNWSRFIWLVVWNIWIHLDYFSIQLGMSSSQLTKSIIFQRGWNHQPVFPSHHPYFHGISTINHPYHPLIDGGRSTTNQLWLDQESFTTFPIVSPAAWPSRPSFEVCKSPKEKHSDQTGGIRRRIPKQKIKIIEYSNPEKDDHVSHYLKYPLQHFSISFGMAIII